VLLSCLEHLQQWIVSLNWRRKNDRILWKFIVLVHSKILLHSSIGVVLKYRWL
jgi:hypothetical protein